MAQFKKRSATTSAMFAVIGVITCRLVHATLVPNYVGSSGTGAETAYDSFITSAAASNDLILNGSGTLGSVTAPSTDSLFPTFTTTGFNDGSAAGNSNFSYFALTEPTGDLPQTYVFNFTGSATGYDISKIQSVAGWSDSQLGDQDFDVFVKTVADPTFTQLGGDFSNAPFNQVNTAQFVPNATMTTITDTTGVVASGVTAIKFQLISTGFNQTSQNGAAGGTLYRDVAVIGAPTGGGPPPPPPPIPTIMPLGDSITDGRGGDEGTLYVPGGYRDPLYTDLSGAGYKFNFVGTNSDNSTAKLTAAGESNHQGETGYRIDQIASGINGWLSAAPANDILLMIGTNDMTQQYDPTPTAPGSFSQHAANRLISLIAQIYGDEPKADIFVSSIIPILTTANDPASRWVPSINADAVTYNQLIQSQVVPEFLAEGYDIHFVDAYSAFLNPDGSVNTSYYSADDDEHPDQAGYNAIAGVWSNAILGSVPEPTLGLLLVAGGLACVSRRGRKAPQRAK